MMTSYAEVIEYLYARLPMFTRDGASAIKKDIDNTILFCEKLDNPHQKFKSIHVAGTNGKGSTSHMLASVLASAGYKVGLYTSPHLLDFRERIRINGEMIAEETVVSFVNENREFIEHIAPSFFEVTVAMAFDYFAKQQVDISVIEVGLGGRLDSTNIIHPELCVITNIGMDHMNLLGDTLVEIAYEKAGIIKEKVPVVVSEKDPEVVSVFVEKATALQAPLRFASDELEVLGTQKNKKGLLVQMKNKAIGEPQSWQVDLAGGYQQKNLLGVLTALDVLRNQGWVLNEQDVKAGLQHVKENTGLQGRWQTLSEEPFIICDTGHNEDGVREVVKNLQRTLYKRLHVLIGAMRDKDLNHMLPQLPQEAIYYFCQPDMPRALPAMELKEKAAIFNLQGESYDSVQSALDTAKSQYESGDLIFIGGSNFVVAEVLRYF
ncbi:bifunctional folylpolyglutamate synthase/dihydrofolate synthase [Sphingobacterium wenxiniae]|nr:folylpolyglutamate synthase/dihydrofolate synthase family protein [Sphingobacterium wenxiniae]